MEIAQPVNIIDIFEKRGFVTEMHVESGFAKFIHRELTFEFLTNTGAKADEKQHRFKNLNIVAQELQFMNIPLHYHMSVRYRDIDLTIPEPEAFTLHKLIVSQRRENPEKVKKDLETVHGMLLFFRDRDEHINRLHQIFNEMPKGWQKKINAALLANNWQLP